MEKSIKRVEKLVHVTNSALAQMKFSLMFDDMNGDGDRNGIYHGAKALDPFFGEKFLDGDDLKRCQNEFKAEANEMLAKMESMFGPNEKNSKAVDRIKEINQQMKHLRLEQAKPPEETEQSRQKLLNLISEEKFSSGVTSSKESGQSKSTFFDHEKKLAEKTYPGPKRTDSILSMRKSPDKSKDELKSKILETQEIVNRGFETARHLAQKVETMSRYDRKEKTPSTDKTVSEINLRSPEEKAESNETVSSVKYRRSAKERKRKRKDDRVNIRVVEVKRKEVESCRRTNLQLQHLPSLHIRGGLQMQKIHNLEIPAGGDSSCVKSNTAICFLSHEQVENEKMGEVIEQVKKENCCCTADNPRGNYVECFNCGKLIRIQETRVDPEKVDEILQECNFDVFDPRIDEFVEKMGTGVPLNWPKKTQPTNADRPDPPPAKPEATPLAKTNRKNKEELPKKNLTLHSLSDRLFRKYKQEADTIESNHQKLDSILQNLFRQVDESREVFENCSFFKNKKLHSERVSKLTATKPVLVNLTGTPFRVRKKQKKLDKSQINHVIESGSSAEGEKDRHTGPSGVMSVQNEEERHRKYFQTEKPRRGKSLVWSSPSGSSESDRKKEAPGRLMPTLARQNSSKRLTEKHKVEEGASSATSFSTGRSCSSNQSKHSGKEDVEDGKNATPTIPSDRLSRKEEMQGKSLRSTSLTRRRTSELEMRKGEFEREKSLFESLSSSSSNSRSRKGEQTIEKDVRKPRTSVPSPVQSSILGAAFRKQESEGKTAVTPLSKSDGKTLSETSSEKSENNYESDFESVTNEPYENGDECEDEEPEGNPGVNKLSTISEVDSELEKKQTDDQKTLRNSRNAEEDDTPESFETEPKSEKKCEAVVAPCKPKKTDSPALATSSESKKTETTPQKTAEASIKSTPTELVTSLKDILTALQNQFVRTESLAEKLTETAKLESAGKPETSGRLPFVGDAVPGPWKMPNGPKLVENLRSARKEPPSSGPKSQRGVILAEKSPSERSKTSAEGKLFSADSLSDEGGSSLGEIVASGRRKKSSEKSDSGSISECSYLRMKSARRSNLASDPKDANTISPFKIELNSEEGLYSEGEIPSDELNLAYERFLNGSIGEVGH